MPISLDHIDLLPKFLSFYQAAADLTDAEERWRLWQERYDFAAVSPTEYGKGLARRLLDGAWERYPAVIEQLPQAVSRLQSLAPQVSKRVAALFELDQAINVRLVTFVGGFEGNAFSAEDLVCFPVEVEMPLFMLAHELVHQVHHAVSGKGGGWQRTVGFLLLEEGLAMRGTKALYPKIPAAQHLSYIDLPWVQACEGGHQEILAGVLPHLSRSDDEALLRFTMQEGPAGLVREGYWAGWHVVGQLLAEGWSFGQIARVPEAEAAPLVAGVLRRILGC